MKQTKERLPSVTSQEVTQEEKADRSTIFDDVFRTIAQKMPQLLIPLINEVFHTNYSEDTDFEQLRNIMRSMARSLPTRSFESVRISIT